MEVTTSLSAAMLGAAGYLGISQLSSALALAWAEFKLNLCPYSAFDIGWEHYDKVRPLVFGNDENIDFKFQVGRNTGADR